MGIKRKKSLCGAILSFSKTLNTPFLYDIIFKEIKRGQNLSEGETKMSKIKSILIALMCLVVCLAFAACGNTSAGDSASGSANEPTSISTSEPSESDSFEEHESDTTSLCDHNFLLKSETAPDCEHAGKREICETALPDKAKKEFIRRLDEVRLTPLMLLYDNYYFYYPLATREEYEAVKKDFFDCAERSGLDKIAERWTVDMYRAEPGESEITDL